MQGLHPGFEIQPILPQFIYSSILIINIERKFEEVTAKPKIIFSYWFIQKKDANSKNGEGVLFKGSANP